MLDAALDDSALLFRRSVFPMMAPCTMVEAMAETLALTKNPPREPHELELLYGLLMRLRAADQEESEED